MLVDEVLERERDVLGPEELQVDRLPTSQHYVSDKRQHDQDRGLQTESKVNQKIYTEERRYEGEAEESIRMLSSSVRFKDFRN